MRTLDRSSDELLPLADWTKPGSFSAGRDPLGFQAASVRLYTSLEGRTDDSAHPVEAEPPCALAGNPQRPPYCPMGAREAGEHERRRDRAHLAD